MLKRAKYLVSLDQMELVRQALSTLWQWLSRGRVVMLASSTCLSTIWTLMARKFAWECALNKIRFGSIWQWSSRSHKLVRLWASTLLTMLSKRTLCSLRLTWLHSQRLLQRISVAATRENLFVQCHSLVVQDSSSWMSLQRELTQSQEEASLSFWSNLKMLRWFWRLIEWMRRSHFATNLSSWLMADSFATVAQDTWSQPTVKAIRLLSRIMPVEAVSHSSLNAYPSWLKFPTLA